MNDHQLELREAYARIAELEEDNANLVAAMAAGIFPDVECVCGHTIGKQCDICHALLCNNCAEGIVFDHEWLGVDHSDCDKCGKTVCRTCARTCFDCYNLVLVRYPVLECKTCSSTYHARCKHLWYTCGAHTDETLDFCGYCVRGSTKEDLQAKIKRKEEGDDWSAASY